MTILPEEINAASPPPAMALPWGLMWGREQEHDWLGTPRQMRAATLVTIALIALGVALLLTSAIAAFR